VPEKLHHLTLIDRVGAFGGAERFAVELTKRLSPDRFDRTLCATRWDAELASRPTRTMVRKELESHGVKFVGLPRSSAVDLASFRPLVQLLRREKVDILHSHKFGSNVWGVLLGGVARTPVVIAHEQTWSYEGKPIRRFLDRELVARRADAFICVSREDRRRMIEIEGIDPHRIILVPNAIPTAPRPRGNRIKRQLGIEDGDPVIGTVCVLRPQKSLDVLLRAGALLTEEFPRLRILIAGTGPDANKLKAIAGELGLNETVVEFLGKRTDVPDVLAAFDVAVSSSRFEGTPLAVMEWMEAGLPIAATRVGGVPELIEDGVHGLLVEPGDAQALAAAVARLLRDRSAAAEMGTRARERRRREFDIDVTARRIETLYEDLYAAARRADPRRVRG
jgi:glycosyltransferase involved in cell wall biosynthesis